MQVDNRYLDGKPNFPAISTGTLVAGGYLSVDGMHASGVGYADLASKVMTALGLPHTAKRRESLIARAFDDDMLLSNYPLELDGLLRLIDIARTFVSLNQFIPKPAAVLDDATHMAISLPMPAGVFTR